MARLYAEIEDENGKTKGMASNERLAVTVYDGNKKAYSVYIEYTDIGDLFDNDRNELPESEKTKGAIVTVREWRNQPEEKRLSHTEQVLTEHGFTPQTLQANDGSHFVGWSKTGEKQHGENLVSCESCGAQYEYYTEPQEVKEGGEHICADCWNKPE